MTRRVLLVEIGTPAELPVVTPPAPRPPSAWVPDPRPSPGLPPPTGLAAVSIADAAVLSWTPSTAGGQTIIEAAPDVAGVPGIWREVTRVGGDTYTISLPGGPRWVRVRAELNGRTSVATNAVLAEPVDVSGSISEFEQELRDLQDLVDAVAAQAAADAAALNVRADDLRADIDATIAEVSTLADLTDDLGTEITRVETESVARDTATVETISLLGAKNGAGTVWLLNMDTVRVSATETLAQWRASLQASFDDANARIDAEETARANADSAQVGRIATMEARMPSGSGSLATQASVTAEASARAAADSAQVGRIEVMEARMPSGDGDLATAQSVTQVSNRVDTVEGEVAAHSGQLAVHTAEIEGKASSSVVAALDAYVREDVDGRITANAEAIAGIEVETESPFSPALGWQFVQNHNGFTITRGSLDMFPSTSNYGATVIVADAVGDPDFVSPSTMFSGARAPIVRALIRRRQGGGWDGSFFWATPAHGFDGAHRADTDPPSDGDWHVVEWDLSGNNDWMGSSITRVRFDFGEGADSVVDVRWIAIGDRGPGANAAVTQAMRANIDEITGRMAASYGLSVTAGGDVAGMQLLAGGGTSAIRFLADMFQIVDPSGGARTEYSNGNWRVYDANGQIRVRMGVW